MSSKFSVFEADGFAKTVQRHLDDIKELFLEEMYPGSWVIVEAKTQLLFCN